MELGIAVRSRHRLGPSPRPVTIEDAAGSGLKASSNRDSTFSLSSFSWIEERAFCAIMLILSTVVKHFENVPNMRLFTVTGADWDSYLWKHLIACCSWVGHGTILVNDTIAALAPTGG